MGRTDSLADTCADSGHGAGPTLATWWPRVRVALTLVFFAAVAALLVRFGSAVEWHAVWTAVQGNSPTNLVLAAALAATGHALVASYDLIGRRTTGHGLAVPRVLSVAWLSYAFNLNLGALIGGVGLRIRLYSRFGLDGVTIGQVYGLSVVTNWLGYLVLVGATLLWTPEIIPTDWQPGSTATATLGVLLMLTALAYLLGCAFAPRRRWQWRGHTFTLPSGRLALLQWLLSTLNWLAMAGVVTILLGGRVDFPIVLGVLLVAAIAGAVAHIPAGLGVIEAVFIALLGHAMEQSEILAALLTYRAIFYLAPLSIALLMFSVMEYRLRGQADARSRSVNSGAVR